MRLPETPVLIIRNASCQARVREHHGESAAGMPSQPEQLTTTTAVTSGDGDSSAASTGTQPRLPRYRVLSE